MTHPFEKSRHQNAAPDRANDRLSEYERGGAADVAADKKLVASGVHQHEAHEHGGKFTKLRFARGSRVEDCEGAKSGGRLDRPGRKRGGSVKKNAHVTINIAPGGGQDRPVPIPVPGGGPSLPPPSVMAGPPVVRPPIMPPPGMPPGVPPGGPPMPMRAAGGRVGLARGGRAKRQMGGTLPAAMAVPPLRSTVVPAAAGLARPVVPAGMVRASGGGVQEAAKAHAQDEPKMPEIHAGARSALGRLARAKAQGGQHNENAAGD